MILASYACDPARSRGRRYLEAPAPTRSDFQRDRDRIVHCTAFRRLVYKTQVFLNHEGDLFRTRLTHSLEVAQLGRSIARTLALNEDLVEAIALAHDLGHTPFGHAGQDALNQCLRDHDPQSAGFEHNMQSLRVVDSLEESYPAFDGLNLTFETREGILKHCSARNARHLEAREPGGVARRFAQSSPDDAPRWLQPGLEAQLANLADEIAYNAHDIDDGVRSGLLSIEQLESVELFARHRREASEAFPHVGGRRLLAETIRRMLSSQVYDVMDATRAALKSADPHDVDAVCQHAPLVCFSVQMAGQSAALKRLLHQNLYRHPQVVQTTQAARDVVRELFGIYLAEPAQIPRAANIFSDPQSERARPAVLARTVADYIAGMTDRFATREHERLTGRSPFPQKRGVVEGLVK